MALAASGKGVHHITTQFVGHIRGSGETENRYSKDHPPAALYAVLESVTLGLPEVAPFVCEDGVDAVADVLRIKRFNKQCRQK
ncbi:hypothetical protein [Citrobacter sp. U14242]|uniref:hypothetical protein n=1 Tax=Citrobacter sp. U14242 TaxID=3390192 RepID=UPI00397CA38D